MYMPEAENYIRNHFWNLTSRHFQAQPYLSVFASGADRGSTWPVGEQTGGGRGAVQEDLELPHVLGGERAGERLSVPLLLFIHLTNLKCINIKSLAGVGTVIKLASSTTSASDTFVPWANLNICVYPVSYIIIHSAVINLAYACTA